MITIADIENNPDVVEALDWPFDFSILDADQDLDWISFEPVVPFHVLAGEGSGGAFIAYGDRAVESLPILHASSEGQAGRVASNLSEWLGILIAIPYWRDLLKFSGNGQLNEMRLTASFMEQEYQEDYHDLTDARNLILSKLPIPHLNDPVRVLHDNVHASDHTLVFEDGCKWDSLFNSFTSANNPNWVTKE